MNTFFASIAAFKDKFSKSEKVDVASCTDLGTYTEHIVPDGIAASYGHEPFDLTYNHYLYQAEPGKVIDGKALADALYDSGISSTGIYASAEKLRDDVAKECDGAHAVFVTRVNAGIYFTSVNADETKRVLDGDDSLIEHLSRIGQHVVVRGGSSLNIDSFFVEKDDLSVKRDISPIGENNSVESSKQDDFGLGG